MIDRPPLLDARQRETATRCAVQTANQRRHQVLNTVQGVQAELDQTWETIGNEVSLLLGHLDKHSEQQCRRRPSNQKVVQRSVCSAASKDGRRHSVASIPSSNPFVNAYKQASSRTPEVPEICESRHHPAGRNYSGNPLQSIFKLCDLNGDGYLDRSEMQILAGHCGFRGDDAQWATRFSKVCETHGCNPLQGIGLSIFSEIAGEWSDTLVRQILVDLQQRIDPLQSKASTRNELIVSSASQQVDGQSKARRENSEVDMPTAVPPSSPSTKDETVVVDAQPMTSKVTVASKHQAIDIPAASRHVCECDQVSSKTSSGYAHAISVTDVLSGGRACRHHDASWVAKWDKMQADIQQVTEEPAFLGSRMCCR